MKIAKYLVIAALLMLPFASDAASKKKPQDSDAQGTCIYNYMSCRDTCDYHQDRAEIDPCKAQCDRRYSCRPKKVTPPPEREPSPT